MQNELKQISLRWISIFSDSESKYVKYNKQSDFPSSQEILKPNSNRHKRVELWAKSINFVNLGCHFPCATSAKNLRSMYTRMPQVKAQFGLKIEKLSHIMGPTPILEIARAYGLRPRLWLLFQLKCKIIR